MRIHTALGQGGLKDSLGGANHGALEWNAHRQAAAAMKLRSWREVSSNAAVRAARVLAVAARQGVRLPDLEPYVSGEGGAGGLPDYAAWGVEHLRGIEADQMGPLRQAGIRTIGDLARLGDDADRALLEQAQDNGFHERPSAPANLLPGVTGAIASRVRYSSFVRELDLRDLVLEACVDCAEPLPLSGSNIKNPADKPSLTDVFSDQRCPVIYLGYLCGHVQEWINLGTQLGEVVHSIALAPGESRNIALVNWRRRQLTSRNEQTTGTERLTASFLQNRAISEVTTAVASEQQSGGTDTQASTAVTAAGFVGAGAVVGGLALGAAGAVVGGVVGTAIEPGGGTAIGAVAGGVAGAAVGGAAGAAAGGLVYAGSNALGKIVSASEGDRNVVADVHQQITLSTSQNASAVRSLWSTVVVEDAQAENVEAQTSNITNYNHMHALNVEYYELLQRYLVRVSLDRVEPILYLPFGFMDFLDFQYVRDYWEAVRPWIDDEGLRVQGDAYFVTEGQPDVPDVLPVPPVPTPPPAPSPPRLNDLQIEVLHDGLTVSVPAPTWRNPLATRQVDVLNNLGLKVRLSDGTELNGSKAENVVASGNRDGYDLGDRFSFANIDGAHRISDVVLSLDQALDVFNLRIDVNYRIRVAAGTLVPGGQLKGQIIRSNGKLKADSSTKTFNIDWKPAADPGAAVQSQIDEYQRKVAAREAVIAENQRRSDAYDALRENIERFKARLQRLLLRRRHFFTRVLLNAIEPEEITKVLESICVRPAGGGPLVRLSDFAQTIPLGMFPGGFILRLKSGKRASEDVEKQLVGANVGNDAKGLNELKSLLGYGAQTSAAFSGPAERDRFTRVEEVYLPTAGLFAEAVLGRSNGAEYLDLERFFNWKDAPIPHQPPPISSVDTGSRRESQTVTPTLPPSSLNVINPVALPDPTGLAKVLDAVQNGSMFRDMSKAQELAGIIGHLATLSGQMGQAASTMTGQAAQQALQAATQIGQTASTLASTLGSAAFQQAGAAFSTMGTMSGQGALLNEAAKIDANKAAASAAPDGSGGDAPDAPDVPNAGGAAAGAKPAASSTAAAQPTLAEETFRSLTGTPPRGAPAKAASPPAAPIGDSRQLDFAQIEVKLRVFIPSEIVNFGPGAFEGDGREFSYSAGTSRAELVAVVSLDPDRSDPVVSLPVPSFGSTSRYADGDGLAAVGKPDWYQSKAPGAVPQATARLQRTEGNLVASAFRSGDTVVVRLHLEGANPLVPGSPDIDARINVIAWQPRPDVPPLVSISGQHDGFPAYELYVNAERMYEYDPVQSGESPLALVPPMDRTVNVDWRVAPAVKE